MRAFISISILFLGTGCEPAATPVVPTSPPPTMMASSNAWVHFDGDVVSSDGMETTLRDPSGATVIMKSRDVRTWAGGTELRVGASLVAMMVDGAHPDQPGPMRMSPTEHPTQPTGPSATPPPARSTGCFGMFKYHCTEGTFIGWCLGAQLCPR